jgi:hypothetical protein
MDLTSASDSKIRFSNRRSPRLKIPDDPWPGRETQSTSPSLGTINTGPEGALRERQAPSPLMGTLKNRHPGDFSGRKAKMRFPLCSIFSHLGG